MYRKLEFIVVSWFLSPVLAGLMSVLLFWLLHVNVIIPAQSDEITQNKKGQRLGLLLLPIFYGATMFVNIYALLHHQEDGGLLDQYAYKCKLFYKKQYYLSSFQHTFQSLDHLQLL